VRFDDVFVVKVRKRDAPSTDNKKQMSSHGASEGQIHTDRWKGGGGGLWEKKGGEEKKHSTVRKKPDIVHTPLAKDKPLDQNVAVFPRPNNVFSNKKGGGFAAGSAGRFFFFGAVRGRVRLA